MPKRWVVERVTEAWMYLGMPRLLVKRLARAARGRVGGFYESLSSGEVPMVGALSQSATCSPRTGNPSSTCWRSSPLTRHHRL